MTSTARRISAACIALALAWLATPSAAPPLYDGLGFPDEPYRYVAPPPGYQHTKAPTTAVLDAPTGGGGDEILAANSAEQGPQFFIAIFKTDLTLPAKATVIHLSATPLAPTTEPRDGQIWGNVYRLAVTTDAGQPTITADKANYISLRAPTGPPPLPLIEYNDGHGWKAVPTNKVGNDIYNGTVPGDGDYALVVKNDGTRPTSSAAGQPTPHHNSSLGAVAVVIGVALALFIAAVLAVRMTRARRNRTNE